MKSNRRRAVNCIGLVAVLSSLGAASAFGQATQTVPGAQEVPGFSACADPQLPRNYLGEHRFNPSLFKPQPFVAPFLTFGMGLARASTSLSILGTTQSLELIGYAPTLSVQFLVMKKLALRLGFDGGFSSGINAPSTVIYGAAVNYQYDFGAMYGLLEEKSWALSAAFDVTLPRQLAVSPARGLAKDADNTFAGIGAFAEQSNKTTYRPNIRVAYALDPTFGIDGLLGYNFAEKSSDLGDSSNSGVLFGMGLDFQLKPAYNVPIGFNLNYLHGLNITGVRPDTNYVYGGVFETISPRFTAGIEGGRFFATVDAWSGALTTRYYF